MRLSMKKDDKEALAILLILIGVVGVIVGPLLTILALNTLFPVLAIPYTLGTWAATVFLFTVIHTKATYNES
jgi:FtsH-binding integral membrane protein